MINRKIHLVWFGKLNNQRAQALESYKNIANVETCVISNNNLNDINVKDYPIHKNFDNLTDVFKSAYLRAYVAYHHGGGYSDVKMCQFNWNTYFDLLEKSNADFLACPLINEHGTPWHLTEIPNITTETQSEIYGRKNFSKYPSIAQFIFKPKTHIAKLWLKSIHQILDKKSSVLDKFKDVNSYRIPNDYPIKWMELTTKLYNMIHKTNFTNFLLEMPQHERSTGKHRGTWCDKTQKYV